MVRNGVVSVEDVNTPGEGGVVVLKDGVVVAVVECIVVVEGEETVVGDILGRGGAVRGWGGCGGGRGREGRGGCGCWRGRRGGRRGGGGGG